MNLTKFTTENLFDATADLFAQLGIKLNSNTRASLSAQAFLKEQYKNNKLFLQIDETFFAGLIDESLFAEETEHIQEISFTEAENKIDGKYKGIMVFSVKLSSSDFTANQLRAITRAFNMASKQMPVVVIYKYGNKISFSSCERTTYKQEWRAGEKIGVVSVLHDIDTINPHAGHLRILRTLAVDAIREYDKRNKVRSYDDLAMAWRRVFSTDVLNYNFYKDYQDLSVKLIRSIHPKQIKNKLKAHQGVLNLLNRIMFIYFVQKKKWLMGNPNFIYHLWVDYKESKQQNTFHEHWLNTIFFSAFNCKIWEASKSLGYLPEYLQKELTEFPYLNGGLFVKHDEFDSFILKDEHFDHIFQFFESYVFTITEDSPLDISLEINPDLLGKMYEGMINATDLDDVDAENGIVYTERPEINFMVRRSLVEVLDKKLNGKYSRDFIFHLTFDEPDQKLELLKRYKADGAEIKSAVMSITACDPSCGSGSMLLGFLQVQMELIRAIDAFLKQPHTHKDDFLIKKQLISECIYGVDIKEWAVRIAELRMWLYMISEAEFEQKELTSQPLLPNLDFKLRQGNSLLQKFGSSDFKIETLLKGRKTKGAGRALSEFIKKKKAFITNQEDSNASYEGLKQEEKTVFIFFIEELIKEKEITIHNRKVQHTQGTDLFGQSKPEQKNIFETEVEKLKEELKQLKELRRSIDKAGRLPFSYDVDFMEVFLVNEENPGFDLIIGNPPYVSFEHILPPEDGEFLEYLLLPENKQEKARVNKEYKEALNKKVYETWPFLAAKVETVERDEEGNEVLKNGKPKTKKMNVYGDKVPGRSDLYVYFQLICPAFLNKNGTFCFIISNSWLDVEFGKYVQHFLLKHTKLKAIYDCNVRSFDAAVNTIIYLHGAVENIPAMGGKTLAKPLKHTTRFIMNKIDYHEAAFAPLLIEQEHIAENTFRGHYRVIPITQATLFSNAFDEIDFEYIGDKWGGKFLKAPEIFYLIALNAKMVKLSSVSKNLGYVHDNSTGQSYPRTKFIKSVKKINRILIEEKNCELFGVSKSGNARSTAPILFPRTVGDKHKILYNPDGFIGKEFYRISPANSKNDLSIVLQLNSSIGILQREVFGITGLGDGGLKFNLKSVEEFAIIDSSSIFHKSNITFLKREQNEIYDELGFDKALPIRNQHPKPLADRKAIDDIIFDELGLTQEERNEVYWSVAELVQQRLNKAASR
ncbi:MAG: hypothetical protein K1X81_02795 [Bacteroidia bacterium]|nr:hypothetical protein [Bacteroidia bacterium]